MRLLSSDLGQGLTGLLITGLGANAAFVNNDSTFNVFSMQDLTGSYSHLLRGRVLRGAATQGP